MLCNKNKKMKSIHDNTIYSIEIQCEKEIIIFHTEYNDKNKHELIDVVFSGVIGHKFEDVLCENILFNIEEISPEIFYNNSTKDLIQYQKYGLPLNFTNKEEFCSLFKNKNLLAFDIGSSYGLSGWVIANKIELIERQHKYNTT